MMIAIPSQDGISISSHFGRSQCFLLYEIEDSKIVNRSVRDNTFTAHAKGQCHGDHGHEHTHGQGHTHGHSEIVEALQDCKAVLCYGMGWRAAAALQEGGIEALILKEKVSPEEAIEKYIAGELSTSDDFCHPH